MPIGRKGWRWFEPRLRSSSSGLKVALAALLAFGAFCYVFFGPVVFDASYWVLGKIARVQADRRVRVGVSVAFVAVYLVAVSVSGSTERQPTGAGATSTPLVATNATSPSASTFAPVMVSPTTTGTAAPTATTGPTQSPTATATTVPSRTPGSPVTVSGDSQTGASQSLKLAGGSDSVAWSATADLAGCYFSLILATKLNGAIVKSTWAILPQAQDYSGKDEWTGVPAGTYVLYEDWSGLLNCKGLWSATLAPH
jgi:hypothetical protein